MNHAEYLKIVLILSNYVTGFDIFLANCMDPIKIELYSRSTRLSTVSVNFRQAKEIIC